MKLWNGKEIGNLTALCQAHHQLITDNKAAIEWWDADDLFVYVGLTEAPLDPQPPKYGEKQKPKSVTNHTHANRETCPTCNRALPRPKEQLEKTRVRATWSIAVPMDERENGAEVLDTLLEECRKILDRPENKKVRYFVLVETLALMVQNKDMLERGR